MNHKRNKRSVMILFTNYQFHSLWNRPFCTWWNLTVIREFQFSRCITTWKRLPIFTKVNTNSTHKWVTTVRSLNLIPDTDGLLMMLPKGISNTARSRDNLKKIKAFMQVPWNLITEGEIILKKFKISLKEHSCYYFQISSCAHLRQSFLKENPKFHFLEKNRK